MKPKGKRHNTIPVPLGGMYSAGAIADIPEGLVRSLRNYVIRPNRFDCRAPFVHEQAETLHAHNTGFAIWQDLVNELTVTQLIYSNDQLNTLSFAPKNSNGIGYGSAVGVAAGAAFLRPTSSTNLLGKLYTMYQNSSGVPALATVFDGATLSITPFNSTIVGRAIVAYNARNFIIDPRVTVTPLNTIAQAYGSGWGASFSNIATINTGTVSVFRLWPTSLVNAASISISGPTIATSSSALPFVMRQDFRNNDPVNAVPATVYLSASPSGNFADLNAAGGRNLAVTVGQLGAASGSLFLWRVSTAGTTAGAAPSFAGALGSTIADGTAVWTAETPVILAQSETTIPSATTTIGFVTRYFNVTMPWRTNSVAISPQITFKSTNLPNGVVALNSIDLAQKDGLADGDARKQNYGYQITAGDFYYPFVNTETAATNAINMDVVLWSEINDPKRVIAKNTYPLQEVAGLGTAGAVTNGRLVVFKRKGMWVFKGIADANEPILPEIAGSQVGCIGPCALDVSRDNILYWIGESHIYKMNVGTDSVPTEIDTPGMFEEIMNRTSTSWVESQSVYNMPILAIDHANKDVWIYTQKGKIYVYSMQTQMWGYLDTNPTGTAAEVEAMIFDPVSNRMLVSFGASPFGSATRFDETSDAADTIVAGGGTSWNITSDVVPRPFELFASRYESTLLELGLFHNATIEQGSITPSFSYDRGATYTTPSGYPVTHYLTNPRIRLPITATGESVTVKISRTGAGGARNWSISKLDALLRVHRGENPKVNAT